MKYKLSDKLVARILTEKEKQGKWYKTLEELEKRRLI